MLSRWRRSVIRLVERRRLHFLRAAGAGTREHSGGRLLDHLIGTSALLAGWGARPAVRHAALFHSVYGTQFLGAGVVALAERSAVQALIGAEAEALVWCWHAVDRTSLRDNLGRTDGLGLVARDGGGRHPVTARQFGDLVDLMLADALDQLPRRDAAAVARQRDWLPPFLPWALPAAAAATRRFFALPPA